MVVVYVCTSKTNGRKKTYVSSLLFSMLVPQVHAYDCQPGSGLLGLPRWSLPRSGPALPCVEVGFELFACAPSRCFTRSVWTDLLGHSSEYASNWSGDSVGVVGTAYRLVEVGAQAFTKPARSDVCSADKVVIEPGRVQV